MTKKMSKFCSLSVTHFDIVNEITLWSLGYLGALNTSDTSERSNEIWRVEFCMNGDGLHPVIQICSPEPSGCMCGAFMPAKHSHLA